uniref:Uncharacterized protein n=1 Tax=Anguilla anguilla TaxID=7936 RepID=A0A0E9PV96_ANGAN
MIIPDVTDSSNFFYFEAHSALCHNVFAF